MSSEFTPILHFFLRLFCMSLISYDLHMSFHQVIYELQARSGLTKTEFFEKIGLNWSLLGYYKRDPNAHPSPAALRDIERLLNVKFVKKGKAVIGYEEQDTPKSIHELYTAPLTTLAEGFKVQWEEFTQSDLWGNMDDETRRKLDTVARTIFIQIEQARNEADAKIKNLFADLQIQIIQSQVEEVDGEAPNNFGTN